MWSSGSGNLNTDKSFNVGSRLRLVGGNAVADPDIGFSGATAGTGFSRATNDITFITSSTEQMRLTSTGDVGIGTTSPARKLHIKNDGQIKLENTGTGGWAGLDILTSSGTNNYDMYMGMTDNDGRFFIDVNSNGDDLVILQNGNVGIGTNNPAQKLHVNGNVDIDNGGIQLQRGYGTNFGVSGYDIAMGSTTRLGIYTAASERLTILNNGYVGIGTTTPAHKLVVSGMIGLAGGNTYIFGGDNEILAGQDGSAYYYATGNGQNVNKPVLIGDNNSYIRFNSANAERMRIDSVGAKVVGTLRADVLNNQANSANIIYRSGSNTIIGNGLRSLVVADNADVGMGTTGPKGRLHVLDGTASSYSPNSEADTVVIESSVAGGISLIGTGSSSEQKQKIVFGTTGDTTGAAVLYDPNNSFMSIGPSATSNFLKLLTGNGTEAMRLAANGNVGINKTSPAQKLDVGAGHIRLDAGYSLQWDNSHERIEQSDGHLEFFVNNTEGLTLDTNGLGIGTTNPSQKLTVAGSIDTITAMGVAGQWPSSQIRLETTNTVDTTGWQGISFDTSTVTNYGWSIGANRSSSGRGSFRFYEHINSIHGAERFTIKQDGNVGIGINNPSQKLEVGTNTDVSAQIGRAHVGYVGFADYAGFAHLDRASTSNYALLHASWGDTYLNKSSGRNIYFRNNNSTIGGFNSDNDFYVDTNTLFVDASANKVGIGVTNPNKQLTFAQTNDDAIQIRRKTTSEGNSSAGSGISWTWNSNSTDTQTWAAIRAVMPGSSNTHLTFSTRSTGGSFGERMRIRDNGNVGIGVTNPSYKLHVGGSIVGTSKSFLIKHPTKEGKQLLHACIEGPENGVYFRGKSTSSILEMPDYWIGLVHIDSMTVDITAIGPNQDLYVESIADDGEVTIGSNTDAPLNYFYVIYGERKDIDELEIEIVDPEYAN